MYKNILKSRHIYYNKNISLYLASLYLAFGNNIFKASLNFSMVKTNLYANISDTPRVRGGIF